MAGCRSRAVAAQAQNAELALSAYGYLPLVRTLGKITEGEWLGRDEAVILADVPSDSLWLDDLDVIQRRPR